jgi:hypothetical protein
MYINVKKRLQMFTNVLHIFVNFPTHINDLFAENNKQFLPGYFARLF